MRMDSLGNDPGLPLSSPPALAFRLRLLCLAFYVDSEDPNSRSHACTSTSPTESPTSSTPLFIPSLAFFPGTF